jgi:hypothetical protein
MRRGCKKLLFLAREKRKKLLVGWREKFDMF